MSSEFYQTSLKFSEYEPDFSTAMAMLHESATQPVPNGMQSFPNLKYRRRTTDNADRIDDLHHEVFQPNNSWQEYSFPAHIEAQPKQQLLTRYGIDEPRDLLVYIALPVLEQHGLVVQLPFEVPENNELTVPDEENTDMGRLRFLTQVGDRFWFQNKQYELLTIHEDQFFACTAIPAWLMGTANVWKPDVTEATTFSDDEADWRDDA
mgnify:FL=1